MNPGFAQTSLELFEQLRRGGHSRTQIVLAGRCYRLAIELMAAMYRPSGKHFVHHLVGMASIVAWLDKPFDMVAASLLHSVYAEGDFGLIRDRRAFLRARVGADVENLVWRYHTFDWSVSRVRDIASGKVRIDVADHDLVVMRVANAVEDFVDGGMIFYPGAKRHEGQPPGLGDELLAITDLVEERGLRAALLDVFDLHEQIRIPDVVRGPVKRTFLRYPEDDMLNPLVALSRVPKRLERTLREAVRSFRRGMNRRQARSAA